MKTILYQFLIVTFLGAMLCACNTEEGVLPRESPSFIKIILGQGFEDLPVRLMQIEKDGVFSGFLVVSNTTSFVEGVNVSKIRITQLSEAGEIVNDSYFPENLSESWSAVDVDFRGNDNIIIVGTSVVSTQRKLLFFQTNLAGDSLKSAVIEMENSSISLLGINKEEDTNDILFIASLNSGSVNTMIGAINPETLALKWSKTESIRSVPSTSIVDIGNKNFSWGFNANNNAEIARTDSTLLQSESIFLQFPSASLTRAKSLFKLNSGEGLAVFGETVINSTKKVFYHNTISNNFQQLGKLSADNTLRRVNKINKGYLITGNTEISIDGTNTFQKDFLIIQTNESGFPQFTQSFGTIDDEELFDAIIINESIYLIGLTVFGERKSMVFIKTNSKGELKN
jgi:hypothetical protein